MENRNLNERYVGDGMGCFVLFFALSLTFGMIALVVIS